MCKGHVLSPEMEAARIFSQRLWHQSPLPFQALKLFHTWGPWQRKGYFTLEIEAERFPSYWVSTDCSDSSNYARLHTPDCVSPSTVSRLTALSNAERGKETQGSFSVGDDTAIFYRRKAK